MIIVENPIEFFCRKNVKIFATYCVYITYWYVPLFLQIHSSWSLETYQIRVLTSLELKQDFRIRYSFLYAQILIYNLLVFLIPDSDAT